MVPPTRTDGGRGWQRVSLCTPLWTGISDSSLWPYLSPSVICGVVWAGGVMCAERGAWLVLCLPKRVIYVRTRLSICARVGAGHRTASLGQLSGGEGGECTQKLPRTPSRESHKMGGGMSPQHARAIREKDGRPSTLHLSGRDGGIQVPNIPPKDPRKKKAQRPKGQSLEGQTLCCAMMRLGSWSRKAAVARTTLSQSSFSRCVQFREHAFRV